MHFLTIAKTVISLLPIIIEAVKAIEAAVPAKGSGAAKLAAVRDILSSVYAATNDATVAFEQLWPVLASTIGTTVSLLNSTGAFKKG